MNKLKAVLLISSIIEYLYILHILLMNKNTVHCLHCMITYNELVLNLNIIYQTTHDIIE